MYELGKQIREIRKKRKLTQKALGDKLGLSESTISKYESNTATPSLDTLRSMSAIFQIPLDELSGTQQRGTVSLNGLTADQAEIVQNLVCLFRNRNINYKKQLTSEQFALLGQIVTEFSK